MKNTIYAIGAALCALFLPFHARADDAEFGAFLQRETVTLSSQTGDVAASRWQMAQVEKAGADGAALSRAGFGTRGWQNARVPNTVLTNLVANGVYPEPYYGLNNAHETSVIPDVSVAGTQFYSYWFRREFSVPTSYRNRRVWMQFDGINYRAQVWLNGKNLGNMAGMFNRGLFDVTGAVKIGAPNALAVLVSPIDEPNGFRAKSDKPRAAGENRNGADGTIGCYTTMLMTAGWDFTFPDGIRDRNTGIWRDIKLFSTGAVALRNPFVQSDLIRRSSQLEADKMVRAIRAQKPNCAIVLQIMNKPWDALNRNQSASVRPQLQTFNENYRAYASSHAFPLVAHYADWQRLQSEEPEKYQSFVSDGVHPNAQGNLEINGPPIEALLNAARIAKPD